MSLKFTPEMCPANLKAKLSVLDYGSCHEDVGGRAVITPCILDLGVRVK
jgi:hypothetical protein